MILLSSHISKEELLDLKNDISFLYPKYTLTNIDSPSVKLQVVSIQEYPTITDNKVPILTPLSIHQMIENNINTAKFTFPQSGFINLHLYQRKITFSGFGSSKQELMHMSFCMGAIVEQTISPKTSLLVSKTLRSDKAQAALKFNVPIVQSQFIYDLFQSPTMLNEEDYKLKLFSGLVFTTSCCGKREKESIVKYIVENGGIFHGGLYSKTSFVVSKSNALSNKLKEAIDMRQVVITDNFKELYSTPESLRGGTLPLLIPSDLFSNLSFYISPKLERCYQNIFLELKILIQQHGGNIVDIADSANYILQMDTEKDNCIEKQSQYMRESQSNRDKRKLSSNDFTNNSTSNSSSSSNISNSVRIPYLRTPIWVERCVEEGRILEPSEFRLFTPTKRTKRSGNFYVSLTGFCKKEYLNLNSSLKWLDINYSTRFKKSMTHLIAKENHISKKTQTAAEWDIPVVGIDWIFNIAEGNLTSEALSNPWSPKRIQKVNSPSSASKTTFNLDISDDDLDVTIIDQKSDKEKNAINTTDLSMQPKSSQNSSIGKPPNQTNKLNSPIVLKSGSSSQRIPPSPKRLPVNLNDSKSTSVSIKSQPKRTVSFLDDDDDDDFPVDYYDEIISHKMIPKSSQKNENESQKNVYISKTNSTPFVHSPTKKTQFYPQSQISPKRTQINYQSKNTPVYLTSDNDDEILDILDEITNSQNSSNNIGSSNNDAKNEPILSQNQITNNSSNISSKVTTESNYKPIENNKNNTSIINNNLLIIQKNSNLVNKADVKPSLQSRQSGIGIGSQFSKGPQLSQQKESIKVGVNKNNFNSANPPSTPNNILIGIERSKSEKLITPPSVIDHQVGQIHANKSLFELTMRQPSPPPPPSFHQAAQQSNEKRNFNAPTSTTSCIKPSSVTVPKNDLQKSVTIVTSDFRSNQPQKPNQIQANNKPTRNFLDDDDDDDFAEIDEVPKHSKVTDASNYIMKIVNRKRRSKKNRESKTKDPNCRDFLQNDVFNDENLDSQLEFETFTQRPVDNDNDGVPIISYEDKDEPTKEAVTNEDEDPLLSFFQK